MSNVVVLLGLSTLIFFSCKNKNEQSQEELSEQNIRVERIAGDSLATSFMIWVKDTVETHKHEWHSETIYVIEGEAAMYLNDTSLIIKPGDVVFIPKNTWHAVKVNSIRPLKVLSVQSPGFDGKDRVFKSTKDAVDADY